MSDNVNRIIQKARIGEERAERLLEEMSVMQEQIDRLTRELAEARNQALEDAAKVVEEEVRGITVDVFVFNGTDAKNRQGHTEFVSTQHMQSYLQKRAAAIRALKEKP